MIRAMLIVTAVSAGAWAVGSQASASKRSCCAPGAACCATGEICCDNLGLKPAKLSCCAPGAACCATGEICCDTFVSALVEDKPKTDKPAKETKLTGTLVCGACKLKQAKSCTNVLQVTEKGKTVNYWLSDKGNDETYHENVCGGGELKGVTVTGVVSEKDGKKSVKVSKFEVKK